MSDPIFMTAEEAAERTGLSKDWLYRNARAGKIPHSRLGRKVRWTKQNLEQLAQESAYAPQEAPLRPVSRAPSGGRLRA